MCPFWIVGLPPVAAGVFGTFMSSGGTLLLSPYLAFILFFAELAFVLEGQPTRGVWRITILAG
jgi:hypothetical protein